MTKTRLTMLIGSVGLLALVLVGWFALVSPRVSEVAALRAETVTVEDANVALGADIASLREREAGLPAQREYAAALAQRAPSTAAQAALFAEVRAAAGRAGISDDNVSSLTPSAPQTGVLAAAPAGAASDPSVDPAAEPAADGAAGAPAASEQPGAEALASMDLTLTVTAPRDQVMAFLTELEGMRRAYLVDTVDLANASDGGTYTLTLTGSLFILPTPVDPGAQQDAAPQPASVTDPGTDTTDTATDTATDAMTDATVAAAG